MSRVVLDTNAVVSALLYPGPVTALAEAWRQRRFDILVSQPLLGEYIRVLHYPKFRLAPDDIRYLIEQELLPFITPVKVGRPPRIIREDPPDNQVLACALAGKADVIVSGDHHLLRLSRYQTIPIMRVADFLKTLGPTR